MSPFRVGHRRVDRRHRCHTQLHQPAGGRGRGRTQPRLRWSTCSPGPQAGQAPGRQVAVFTLHRLQSAHARAG